MRIKLNFIILTLFCLVSLLFNYLSNGNYSDIGSDFPYYFNRLAIIRDYNIPFSDWFSNNHSYPLDPNFIDNWIPTPFYSLIFLGPFFLHGSNFLFAIQGISIAYLTYRIIRKHLKDIYFCIDKNILNLIMIIGSLNPAFLKDSLTSGPVSICNLFLLYGLF